MSVSLKVAVRVRPFTQEGAELGVRVAQNAEEEAEVELLHSGYNQTRFSCSWAWWSAYGWQRYCSGDHNVAESMKLISQDEVYETMGHSVLDRMMSGNAVVLFNYGLSGSGKTFTAMGPDAPDTPDAWFKREEPHPLWGLFPRLMHDLFGMRREGWTFRMSYIQNVVDIVRDLLSPNAEERHYKTGLRKDPDGFMHLDWCRSVELSSFQELRAHLQAAGERKAIAPTQFGRHSARGHCILTMEVEMTRSDNPEEKRHSRLYLCELAGTEPAGDVYYAQYEQRVSEDGEIEHKLIGPHQDQSKTRELQDQGRKINLSLSEMAQLFMKMADAIKNKRLVPGKSIPGCNSYFLCKFMKDTILQAHTYLVCAIRPEVEFHHYTFSTLGFARNASSIRLVPRTVSVAASPAERKLIAEMDQMKLLVEQLQAQNEALQQSGGGGSADTNQELQRVQALLAQKQEEVLQARAAAAQEADAADDSTLGDSSAAGPGNIVTPSSRALELGGLPERPDGPDLLGVLPLARAVARTLAACEAPFTVGILAQWGVGKSFLIRKLLHFMKEESDNMDRSVRHEVVTIEFDAWDFAGNSTIWAALVKQLHQRVEAEYSWPVVRWERLLRKVARFLCVAAQDIPPSDWPEARKTVQRRLSAVLLLTVVALVALVFFVLSYGSPGAVPASQSALQRMLAGIVAGGVLVASVPVLLATVRTMSTSFGAHVSKNAPRSDGVAASVELGFMHKSKSSCNSSSNSYRSVRRPPCTTDVASYDCVESVVASEGIGAVCGALLQWLFESITMLWWCACGCRDSEDPDAEYVVLPVEPGDAEDAGQTHGMVGQHARRNHCHWLVWDHRQQRVRFKYAASSVAPSLAVSLPMFYLLRLVSLITCGFCRCRGRRRHARSTQVHVEDDANEVSHFVSTRGGDEFDDVDVEAGRGNAIAAHLIVWQREDPRRFVIVPSSSLAAVYRRNAADGGHMLASIESGVALFLLRLCCNPQFWDPFSIDSQFLLHWSSQCEHVATLPLRWLAMVVLALVSRLYDIVAERQARRVFALVVDNLDRTGPDDVVRVLRALQLLLTDSFAPIYTLLAVDTRLVVASIEHASGDVMRSAGVNGYEFLDKLIQLPVNIPDPPAFLFTSFVGSKMLVSDNNVSLTCRRSLARSQQPPGDTLHELDALVHSVQTETRHSVRLRSEHLEVINLLLALVEERNTDTMKSMWWLQRLNTMNRVLERPDAQAIEEMCNFLNWSGVDSIEENKDEDEDGDVDMQKEGMKATSSEDSLVGEATSALEIKEAEEEKKDDVLIPDHEGYVENADAGAPAKDGEKTAMEQPKQDEAQDTASDDSDETSMDGEDAEIGSSIDENEEDHIPELSLTMLEICAFNYLVNAGLLDRNGRRAIRIFNVYKVQRHLVTSNSEGGNMCFSPPSANREAFLARTLKWTVLCERWPFRAAFILNAVRVNTADGYRRPLDVWSDDKPLSEVYDESAVRRLISTVRGEHLSHMDGNPHDLRRLLDDEALGFSEDRFFSAAEKHESAGDADDKSVAFVERNDRQLHLDSTSKHRFWKTVRGYGLSNTLALLTVGDVRGDVSSSLSATAQNMASLDDGSGNSGRLGPQCCFGHLSLNLSTSLSNEIQHLQQFVEKPGEPTTIRHRIGPKTK